jgi:uncharacterized protein (TIGR03435 family)
MRRVALWLAAVLAVGRLCAQGMPATKEFEVVSIRPAKKLSMEERIATVKGRQLKVSPESLSMPYESMTQILQHAFGLANSQLIAPDWTDFQHFSIAAKLPAGATQDDIPEMLRTMLLMRFHIAYHTEVRNTRALVLTLAKNGIKAEKLPRYNLARGCGQSLLWDITTNSQRHRRASPTY